jgi:hypothetical protein
MPVPWRGGDYGGNVQLRAEALGGCDFSRVNSWQFGLTTKENTMRKLIMAPALIAMMLSLSGCWWGPWHHHDGGGDYHHDRGRDDGYRGGGGRY